MPELPEVETIRRDLNRQILNYTIQDVRFFDTRVIRDISPQAFRKILLGRTIDQIHRRGKALIFQLNPKPVFFVVQLMMTGQLVLRKKMRREPATKVVFVLSNGRYLHYNDQRVFGRLQVVADLETMKYFRNLGPEPLSKGFTAQKLAEFVRTRRRAIKNVLLDHTTVAGIGNIYAAEILFAAGIDPRRPAAGLESREISRLYRAIKQILRQAVSLRGSSVNTYRDAAGQKGSFINYIKVYDRTGQACPRCHNPVSRIVQAGRSTFFCEGCQK